MEKRGIEMARKSYRPEQIINKVREAEVLIKMAGMSGIEML